jgi:hypothetical protein
MQKGLGPARLGRTSPRMERLYEQLAKDESSR